MMALAKLSMKSCATLGARKIKAKKMSMKEEMVAKAMSCVSTWVLYSFPNEQGTSYAQPLIHDCLNKKVSQSNR